jgi:CRP-like cAMP-binding protein
MTPNQLLRIGPLFSTCEERVFRKIAQMSQAFRAEERALLARAGTPLREVYYIASGKVIAYNRDRARGRHVLLRFLEEHSLAGDAELLSTPRPSWQASLRVLRETHYVAIPVAILTWAIEQDHGLAARLYAASCRERTMQTFSAQVTSMHDTETRLLRLLVDWAERAGSIDGNRAVLPGLQQTDMALGLGTTRKTIGRTLKRLQERGLVERHGAPSAWVLPHLDQLRELIPQPPLVVSG